MNNRNEISGICPGYIGKYEGFEITKDDMEFLKFIKPHLVYDKLFKHNEVSNIYDKTKYYFDGKHLWEFNYRYGLWDVL